MTHEEMLLAAIQERDRNRMTFTSGRYRYENDPKFKMLVDMMEMQIERLEFTPSEIRDAAMLATIQWESRQIRSQADPKFFGKIPEVQP